MNNETTVARLILGTMSYGTTIDQDRAFALMDRFVAAGGVWLDTADCYAFWDDPSGVGGASERVIGRWLRANDGIRERVSIATKVRQNPLVPHRWPESAEGLSAHAIVTAMAGSVRRPRLQRDGGTRWCRQSCIVARGESARCGSRVESRAMVGRSASPFADPAEARCVAAQRR